MSIRPAITLSQVPDWEFSDTLILKPGPEFAEIVGKQCDTDELTLDRIPDAQREKARAYLAKRREQSDRLSTAGPIAACGGLHDQR